MCLSRRTNDRGVGGKKAPSKTHFFVDTSSGCDKTSTASYHYFSIPVEHTQNGHLDAVFVLLTLLILFPYHPDSTHA